MIGKQLVCYSSSESSEEEEAANTPQTTEPCVSVKEKLPLPGDIIQLFSDSQQQKTENPSEHGGRLRSFPHVEGNWATLVFAKYEPSEEFLELQAELFKCLRPLEFQLMDDYHVSFSRTVVVRHHWIKDLKDSLLEHFTSLPVCACEIDGVSVLTNDEKSRSFLALNVTSADNVLESYVSAVDECFHQYNLQKYYKPPKFHVSIGWCLGDVSHLVTDKMKCSLQERLKACLLEDSELKHFVVDKILMKTGNKLFSFALDQRNSRVT